MRVPAASQQGFTYIGLLIAVTIIGLLLTVVAGVWQTTVQREREAQLLWVGHAYRMAVSEYFASGHRYPATLQDLLVDDRFPVPQHHLRRLYPDPMTGRADWVLVLTPDQSGIQGVASSSQATPFKRDGFDLADFSFKDADCYCQWKFVYVPYRWTGAGAAAPVGAPVAQPGQGGWGSPQPGGPTTAPGVPVPLPRDPTPPAISPPPGFGPH